MSNAKPDAVQKVKFEDDEHCTVGPCGEAEVTDPRLQGYYHCDCWGGDQPCCRCDKVKGHS